MSRIVIRRFIAAGLAGLLAACATPPESADQVLARSSQAMGAN